MPRMKSEIDPILIYEKTDSDYPVMKLLSRLSGEAPISNWSYTLYGQ